MIDLVTIDAGVARASREVAGKSTYDAVLALEVGPIQAPHRAALLRWIHELVQRRIGADLAEEEAEREVAEDPALAKARGPVAVARTYDEARRGLLIAPNVVELEKTLGRMGELADPIAAVRRERRMRRFEIARRLGLDHPWALALDGGVATVSAVATAVLDATEPLARDLHKRHGASPARSIEDAFARDAREGWPARLTPRWLEDVFRTVVPRPPKGGAADGGAHAGSRGAEGGAFVGARARGAADGGAFVLPMAIGGASFLRAAADWGFAARVASTARSLPFALARDPAPTEAFLHGDLLALALASRAFAKRKLGLPARAADAHARVLARASFFTLRALAAVAWLGRGESATDDEIEHVSARLFGRPLARGLGVAWANGGFSGRCRDDVPARLAAAVRAFGAATDLVERHDEDWFDNPRAAARLAHVAAGPVWQGDEPTGIDRIARTFEETLG
ncbi:MAG: hypothetical protein KIT84_08755 [Labilithrix sp.]|nr:hypothetical protein [Labilithrix sp.]